MDISSIGTQYLNGGYIPMTHNSPASAVPGLGQVANGSFEEMLKKASKQAEAPKPSLNKAPIDKNDKLYKLCMDLETFLIKNLIKSMRSTVQKSELIKSGFAGEMYEDMLYDEYAKEYAQNANFGFAEMAYRELSANTK